MTKVGVILVRGDSHGRIRVRPSPERSYEFIWRDASCVRWDEKTSECYVDPDQHFAGLEEFDRIRQAVSREYGDDLVVSKNTAFENLSALVIEQIRSSAA